MASDALRISLALAILGAPPSARADSESWYVAVAEPPAAAEASQQSGPARAPSEPSTDGSEPRSRPFSEMIENIVVSARKRQESIQQTPVSVTAFSAESIKQLGARRIQDITPAVPNLQYDRTVGVASARVTARGVGQIDPIGTFDPGVGLYVDGVFLPRAQSGLLSVADVERIEVVRGPQGTVFGKNTIGGAVNVITRQPTLDFAAEGEVRVGNFDLFETRATVNVPLTERIAARLGLATATRDGFEKDRLGGTDPNDEKLLAARGQLLLLPDDDLEILLSADTSRENQVPSQGKCLPVNPGMQGLQVVNAIVGFTDACSAVAQSSNPRRVESDLSFLRDDLETYGGSARISWAIGANTNVRSITALRGLDSESVPDFDGTRIELVRPAVDDASFRQSQLSQELTLSSSALDGRVEYLLGLFAFQESSDDQTREGVLSRIAADDVVNPLPGLTAAQTADAVRGAQIRVVNKVDNLSYAAFGQASFALTDRLDFTAGLRLTQDRRRLFRRGVALTPGISTARQLVQPGDLTTFFDRSARVSDFTPSASLSYEFSDSVLGYLSYNTGFKSGGFNGRAFPAAGDDQFIVEFDPEDLTTYEVGVKATFADQRVGLNAAAFYSVYEDIQLPVLSGDPAINNVNILLLNAGESIISGGELELVVTPYPNLQLRQSLGVLNDRFTDFDDPGDPQAKDRRPPFVSSFQTNSSVEYVLPLSGIGVLTARTSWSTRSRQFLEVTNSPVLEASKRGLLDARLSLQLDDGLTEIALFGQNLLDREYLLSGADFSATFGFAQRFFGPPRTYGLEIRRRY